MLAQCECATNATLKWLNWQRVRYVYFTTIKTHPVPHTERGGTAGHCQVSREQRNPGVEALSVHTAHENRGGAWGKPGVKQGGRRRKTIQETARKEPSAACRTSASSKCHCGKNLHVVWIFFLREVLTDVRPLGSSNGSDMFSDWSVAPYPSPRSERFWVMKGKARLTRCKITLKCVGSLFHDIANRTQSVLFNLLFITWGYRCATETWYVVQDIWQTWTPL